MASWPHPAANMATTRSQRRINQAELILQEELDDGANNDTGTGTTNKTIMAANNNKHVDTLEANYELNAEKALQHKIDAANRQDIKYDVTGGGHRITMNTGTYELVKNAIPAFYEEHKDYSASVRPHVELKNRIVDIMVVVNNLITGRKTFVINLYNTTSLILVNGKSPNIFRKHLDEIMKSISGEDVSNIHDVLNQVRRSNRDKKPSAKMRELQQSPPKKTSAKRKSNNATGNSSNLLAIAAGAANMAPDTTNTTKDTEAPNIAQASNPSDSANNTNQSTKPKTRNSGTKAAPAAEISGTDNDSDTTQCPRCNRPPNKDMVMCDSCSSNIHNTCEGLSADEITLISNSNYAYVCTSCNALIEAQRSTPSHREQLQGNPFPGALNGTK